MGAPAVSQKRNRVTSCAVGSYASSNIRMNGAGLAVPVHRCFPMRCRAVTGSNASSTCAEAPANVGAMTPKVRPRAWVTGAGMNITSERSIFKALTACFGQERAGVPRVQAAFRPGLGTRGVENQVRIVGRGEAGQNARIAVGAEKLRER